MDGPPVGGGSGPDALADGPGAEEAGVGERRVPGARLLGGPEGLRLVEAIAVAHDDDALHSHSPACLIRRAAADGVGSRLSGDAAAAAHNTVCSHDSSMIPNFIHYFVLYLI